MTKTAYTFHPETGGYMGSVECQMNPLEWGEFLIPQNATTVNPGSAPEGKTLFWDGKKWKSK